MASLPNFKYTLNSAEQTTPEVNEVKFFKYSQRLRRGLDTIDDVWPCIYILDVADAETLIQTLRAAGGAESFDNFTPPRYTQPQKAIAQTWTRQALSDQLDQVNVTFIRVYDL